MMFFCFRIRPYVSRMGLNMSSKLWCPPARPPVHCSIMYTDGLASAMATTCRMLSVDPGLKATWRMPACDRLDTISFALSSEGTPAAMHRPSIGKPYQKIMSTKKSRSFTCSHFIPHFDGERILESPLARI